MFFWRGSELLGVSGNEGAEELECGLGERIAQVTSLYGMSMSNVVATVLKLSMMVLTSHWINLSTFNASMTSFLITSFHLWKCVSHNDVLESKKA